ncbi:hypothetical protein GCM10027299_56300 [Larkinella ripae]
MLNKLNNKYRELDHFAIRLWDHEDYAVPEKKKLLDDFNAETNICGAYLYLEIRSLVMENVFIDQTHLYSEYDYNKVYTFEILEKWFEADSGNTIWTSLEYKWASYSGCFNFNAFSLIQQEEIITLCKKINLQKYNDKPFDRHLIASIGDEFHTYIIPRLYRLVYYNSLPIPNSLTFILTILFLTIVSGVLIPLLLSAIKVNLQIQLIASSFVAYVLILSLFYFLLKFKGILNEEIQLNKR